MARSGESGLPKDWQFIAHRWRASVSVPLDEEILAWASETEVSLVYNDKKIRSSVLSDLLLSGESLSSPSDDFLVHFREHLSFGVHVETCNQAAINHLINHLRPADQSDELRVALAELETIARLSPDVAGAIHHAIRSLSPHRKLTCWVHLEGPLQRGVIRDR